MIRSLGDEYLCIDEQKYERNRNLSSSLVSVDDTQIPRTTRKRVVLKDEEYCFLHISFSIGWLYRRISEEKKLANS